jgi:ankyrin repeat protein
VSTLDNFRKDAKRWLKALRAADADARARFERAYPGGPAAPTLRDVQHALAREQGAVSWVALRERLDREQQPPPSETPLQALLRAADRRDAAAVIDLVERHPGIVSARGALDGHSGMRTALHFGVHDAAVVEALLEHGADPNVRDDGDNAFPLHFAVEGNDTEIVRLLVEHGADTIGTGDGHELDVIGWAAVFGKGDPVLIDYLLAHGSRHNILSAVAMGEVETIRAIAAADRGEIDRRMDRTNRRRRPLHLAVVKRQPLALAALIALGADLDAEDASGLTALDQAALNGQHEMAQALVEAGAALRLPAAVALGRADAVAAILRANPGALHAGGRWARVLVPAAEKGSAEVIETLIRHGASVNVRDVPETAVDETEGYTPLHAAAWNNNLDAVRVLLAHGADVRARESKYGATPAGWADYAGHREARDLIMTGPIDIFDAITLERPDLIPGILARDPGAASRPYGAYAACDGESPGARDKLPLEVAIACKQSEAAGILRKYTASPAADSEDVATFLRFACWDHTVGGKGDHEMYAAAALRRLAEQPGIARASLYTAVVCGEVDEVERLLSLRPEAARESGGPRGWPPLLYLCFTRFAHQPSIDNAVPIAAALLDRGADPNAFYMAGHARYSALVGVAGEGEQGAPRQPNAAALFQLLLERGAGPFDMQVLYNTHFSGDVLWWLRLVYDHSVKIGRGDVWRERNWDMLGMGGYGPGSYFLLKVAIEHDDAVLAEWLLEHGADPNIVASSHPKFKPRLTLYEEAVLQGCDRIAELLVRHGASTAPLLQPDGRTQFVEACVRMNREAVRAAVERDPSFLRWPEPIFGAAQRDRADAVGMLLDLGVPLEIESGSGLRLLHEAAGANALSVARLLLARGAEVDHREPTWNATPFGFAAHGQVRPMMDLLGRVTRDVWSLAFNGYVDRLRELFAEDPALATAVNEEGYTLLWWLTPDESRALEIVELLLAHGANAAHRGPNGATAADWARTCAMSRVAARLTRAAESSAGPSGESS